MNIKILDLAERDLVEGFRFYDAQEAGLGSYFLTNLYADIESLKLYAGIHKKLSKHTIVFFRVDSLSQSFIRSREIRWQFMQSWIVAAIPPGSESG